MLLGRSLPSSQKSDTGLISFVEEASSEISEECRKFSFIYIVIFITTKTEKVQKRYFAFSVESYKMFSLNFSQYLGYTSGPLTPCLAAILYRLATYFTENIPNF
jgi:hypothetical protein